MTKCQLGICVIAMTVFRRGSVLRAYLYDFIELLAPHLPKKFVRKAERLKTQEELNRDLEKLAIPKRSI